jgi:hypothetical protein
LRIVCLQETGVAQTAVALEELAAGALNRRGANRGQLVVAVGFAKGSMIDAESAQSVNTLEKLAFVRDAEHDEMGMRGLGWQKGPGNFNGGVARLNDLLRERKVRPDEEIQIRWFALQESHGCLLRL